MATKLLLASSKAGHAAFSTVRPSKRASVTSFRRGTSRGLRFTTTACMAPSACSGNIINPQHLHTVARAYAAWQGFANWTQTWTKSLSTSLASDTTKQNINHVLRQMRMFAVVAPFAAIDVSSGANFATNVWLPFWQALFGFTNFYLFILFMRVLLSWFPALDWSRNPWLIVKVITDPYLNVFRNLVPALFMAIDLTPLIGFMLLQDFVAILENCVVENLFSDTIDEPTSDAFAYMPPDFTRFADRPY